jgi:hypothetical protein
MNKFNYLEIVRVSIAFTILTVIGGICCVYSYASEEPQSGSQYRIIGPLYLTGVYRNLNKRQLNRQMAVASLSAVRFSGPEVAFQREVPIGTIMTIIGPAPKRVLFPFYANQYFVRLDNTDMLTDLDIILELNRGIEGALDGLNPKLFSRP